MNPEQAARNALQAVLEAVAGEKLAIICDDEKRDIGQAFAQGGFDLGLWVRCLVLETGSTYRKTVPPQLLEFITGQQPDIFINLFRGPAQEVSFRIQVSQLETRRRVRLGHCPGITMDMLTDGALALTQDEYETMQNQALRILHFVRGIQRVRITNAIGTDLVFSVKGRPFFTDTKLDWKTVKWMNLPVGEVIVGPVEDTMNGTLVCDTAVGGIGLLDEPVTLEVKNGKVVAIHGKNQEQVDTINENLAIDNWASIVGEFAFGLNPKARIVEEFLETEKVGNTVHVAFGNNIDYPGGCNPSANHMDFLISEPTVHLIRSDGSTDDIMVNGEYRLT